MQLDAGRSVSTVSLEMEAITYQAQRYAMTDPLKARQLLDLAERERPDGSPSLAASIPGGYDKLQKLRDDVTKTILDNAKTERDEARETLRESTKDNYINALGIINELGTPEAVAQWAAENIDSLTPEDFKAQYGDYRANLMQDIKAGKSNTKPAGNDEALAEHMEAIRRGTADFDDIRNDQRLNRVQKQKIISEMQTMSQQAALGYLSDASVAQKMMNDQQIHSMLRAVRSESGHLLRAWNYIKKDPDLSRQRMQQLYDATGGLEGAQHRLTAFVNAATDADRAGVLSDSLKAKTIDMFLEYRTLNLLSSAKTHVVNTAGNAGTIGAEIWNRFTAETMGMGQGVAKGETFAFINGLWDGMRKVRAQWSTHKADQGGTLAALRNLNGMWQGDTATSSLIGDAGMTERALTKANALDVIGDQSIREVGTDVTLKEIPDYHEEDVIKVFMCILSGWQG